MVLNSLRIYSSSKRGRKIRRRISTSSIKRQIRRFHFVVVQWTSKKVLKSVMHVRAVVLIIKPIVFFFFKLLWSTS